ncbi:MAG TPA: NAD(P)/FAD-dependent oxidoreductase [Chloroflexia bacterium]|nr:NAD(P)/FAD-dependent oxidoreductase [Chloroflexia bacterium]
MAGQGVDVCVVGAGVAGIACAQGLARQGASVVLLDRLDPMPISLKAEKLDGEAVIALIRFGFQPAVDATLTPLHNVSVYFGEHSLGKLRLNMPEAGGLYHVLINSLRAHLDPRIDFRRGAKVVGIKQHSEGVEVVTGEGTSVTCRLLVMATGDARHLLKSLGATYQTLMPHQVFVAAFTMDGALGDPPAPDDSRTYHNPVPGGPIAYATFFRLGDSHRANIFCPGPIAEEWQRDLKERPLDAMSAQNRSLAAASRSWRIASPVMIRKLQVTRLRMPAVPRVVALGDAAHTIDPSGGGGLTFSLLETEILLNSHIKRWLQTDDFGPAAIRAFYDDPRRTSAMRKYFGRGRYIFSLNHDKSVRGDLRRLRFIMQTKLASRMGSGLARDTQTRGRPWQLPAPYLYEK